MIQPDGRAALDVRERYLRQQRRARRFSDRGGVMLWLGVGALMFWAAIVGFAGLSH